MRKFEGKLKTGNGSLAFSSKSLLLGEKVACAEPAGVSLTNEPDQMKGKKNLH